MAVADQRLDAEDFAAEDVVDDGLRTEVAGAIDDVSSMDGLASLPANGFCSASKFALEGFTEALWQEIEPLGLHAMVIQPGSFRTGIENRTKVSGEPIEDYAATAGAFRAMTGHLTPEMFPGDPRKAAEVIYAEVNADKPRHRVVLGSDAQRRIGVKLDALRAEFDAGKRLTFFPWSDDPPPGTGSAPRDPGRADQGSPPGRRPGASRDRGRADAERCPPPRRS